MKHVNLTITGKVQGVFFRDSTKKKAKELGLKGYVKNLPNGSVYTELEGTQDKIKDMIIWCNKGPETAIVKNVEIKKSDLIGYDSFEIKP